MRILVIGAGAVGGYFGARLQAARRDVTFLVRERRAQQLRSEGLRIRGRLGDVTVTPTLLSAQELQTRPEAFDLILLSTKAYSLQAAMDDFAPAVGPRTAILPLLNGMRHLDTLVERFGETAVLGGMTRVVAYLNDEGVVTVFEQLHDLTFGERDRSVSPRIQAINATLSGCGFDARLVPDVLAAMWLKWVLLSSTGAITLLGRGNVGEVNRAPGGPALASGVVEEALSIAAANGYPQEESNRSMLYARLVRQDTDFVSSLYRDLHAGSAIEADQILGDLLRRAAEHGVVAPLLNAAYVQTKVYEQRRA